ncbi:MAG: YaaA family protein [Tannerellaceae bacterium]|nr:YaaA family protein [Tannerellaceae bacterium]
MLFIITSAKTMSGSATVVTPEVTLPRFQQEANEIALQMTEFTTEELGKLLKVNPALAIENYRRFQEFHSSETLRLPSLLAYTGVVYKYIRPEDFTPEDFLFAQQHMRIASIGYGLLRPLDLIKPYRMEYDIILPEPGDINMYGFWSPRQTDLLIDEVKANGGILFNLASQEIQPAFTWKRLSKEVRVISPEFKIIRNGKPKTIVIYTKMARGAMSRYIIKNRINDPEQLKAFSWEGFTYNEALSGKNEWVFLQNQ